MSQIATRRNSIEKLKKALSFDNVKTQFDNALKENAGPFMTSIIDLVNSDTKLQDCEPVALIMECMKAATLKLPINKQLGFAWIIPYANVPQFQIGYKGYVQLAMRTGQYKYLNADCLYEGMDITHDRLTGAIHISGEARKNAKIIGYFCYMELTNGFSKALYMTTQEAQAWGKRYSPAYAKKDSPWKNNFDEMALKTVIKRVLSKYGIMSIEMQQAIQVDVEAQVDAAISQNANKEVIDITDNVTEIEPETNQPCDDTADPVSETKPTRDETIAEITRLYKSKGASDNELAQTRKELKGMTDEEVDQQLAIAKGYDPDGSETDQPELVKSGPDF